MSYKPINPAQDFQQLKTAINEVVTVSGSTFLIDPNVKFFRNISSGSAEIDLGGTFETVYDASPTASLSSPLFDITYGFATGSSYNVASTTTSSQTEKVKIYRHMASLLLGDPDSVFTVNSVSRNEAIFVLFKRNIYKDELKKGSVSFTINSTAPAQYSASDAGAAATFKQSVGGDYAPLKYNGTGSEVGLVYYNAGIVVLPPDLAWGAITLWSGSKTLINIQSSGTINQMCDGFRKKTETITINNQTDLQSSIYFCRAFNNEFNYSSNPTFVDNDGLIRVISGSNILSTRTYITTVGLYDENDNLLAVGKTNKPITKSFELESILKLRLDY